MKVITKSKTLESTLQSTSRILNRRLGRDTTVIKDMVEKKTISNVFTNKGMIREMRICLRYQGYKYKNKEIRKRTKRAKKCLKLLFMTSPFQEVGFRSPLIILN